jgi:hypothetical protein
MARGFAPVRKKHEALGRPLGYARGKILPLVRVGAGQIEAPKWQRAVAFVDTRACRWSSTAARPGLWMEPLPRSTSWTAHLREARLSGSTPGLHRTPSAPVEVQDEYDPEAPDLGPEEYDPEAPALALAAAHTEEYDPEEPALKRVSSVGHGDEEYDPAKPISVRGLRARAFWASATTATATFSS